MYIIINHVSIHRWLHLPTDYRQRTAIQLAKRQTSEARTNDCTNSLLRSSNGDLNFMYIVYETVPMASPSTSMYAIFIKKNNNIKTTANMFDAWAHCMHIFIRASYATIWKPERDRERERISWKKNSAISERRQTAFNSIEIKIKQSWSFAPSTWA